MFARLSIHFSRELLIIDIYHHSIKKFHTVLILFGMQIVSISRASSKGFECRCDIIPLGPGNITLAQAHGIT